MKEIIESFKQSSENDVVSAVQGTYKQKRIFIEQSFDENTATKKSLKWGIAQAEKGIGKFFSRKDAVNSLRKMSEIAKELADYFEQKNSSFV